MNRRGPTAGALAAVTLLLAAACGSGGGEAATSTLGTTPSSSAPAGPDIARIIPIGGDIAEVVFALGVGDHVVASDLSTTYPPDAVDLPKFGFERALNAEPIIAYEPTVVIGTDAAGPDDTLDAIERVGVPVTIIEREFSPTGPAAKIRAVGAALGLDDEAASLAADLQAEIDAATVDPSVYAAPMRVVALYLRGGDLQFVLGEQSGIDWVIEAAGAIDVAREIGVAETAPITAESLIAAAPDVIVVPESGLQSAGGIDALLAVPGIAETPAGARGAILVYDDQLMLGNGPRTGQFLETLVADLQALDVRRTEGS